MTCAACASGVEKKLNRMPGVRASVNFALERASVDFPIGTSVDDLVRTVEATGYSAAPVRSGYSDEDGSGATGAAWLAASVALTVPVLLAGSGYCSRSRRRWSPSARGRSTGPPWSTCGTARQPWTPSPAPVPTGAGVRRQPVGLGVGFAG
jgi:cation transport ATPase